MSNLLTERYVMTGIERRHVQLPESPRSIEETGLSFQFLVELITKTLFLRGQVRLQDLIKSTKLSMAVLEPVLAFLRTEYLCEVMRRG